MNQLAKKVRLMVKVIVIGSAAIDLVVTALARPKKGETIIGESFKSVPGGKGANQAVAAARLGADVALLGCVGSDGFGKEILANLVANGVATKMMLETSEIESGTAHITLAEQDNSIIVVKGANDFVTPQLLKTHSEAIAAADIVLVQQEIPEETVDDVVEMCYQFDVPVMLNPAPARKIRAATLEKATYLTPNEHEANVLFGVDDYRLVLANYPNKVFVTEGEAGVRYHDGEKEVVVPTYEVEVIDTTGAGDTFNAAFAVAIAEGNSLKKSLQFANRAASLSVEKFGAQGGMPLRDEVESQLKLTC